LCGSLFCGIIGGKKTIHQHFEVILRMKNARRSERPGLDPVVALTLIFVVLKAMGLISWSWFWVLAPLWITFFLFVSIFSAILVGGRIAKGKW
jgi:hypothetical protein